MDLRARDVWGIAPAAGAVFPGMYSSKNYQGLASLPGVFWPGTTSERAQFAFRLQCEVSRPGQTIPAV